MANVIALTIFILIIIDGNFLNMLQLGFESCDLFFKFYSCDGQRHTGGPVPVTPASPRLQGHIYIHIYIYNIYVPLHLRP